MYQPEMLYLFVQLQQRELIQQAEQARLIHLARENQLNHRGLGTRIIKWFRTKLDGNSNEESSLDPCCISTPCGTLR